MSRSRKKKKILDRRFRDGGMEWSHAAYLTSEAKLSEKCEVN